MEKRNSVKLKTLPSTICVVVSFLGSCLMAWATDPSSSINPPANAEGPFKPTIESLANYKIPEWFQDAKFGIFMHWGPQTVGGVTGWYARRMYEQGNPAYEYHLKTYGHPSQFGYKDVCNLFKAEKFDQAQADALVKLYKQAGARYIVPVGVHHDNFDMWDSKYQPRWNAKVTTGKDIIGMWKKAADDNNLRFGVSTHVARSYRWFQTSHRSDTNGPLAGVPYDGQEPQFADLYGVPWKDSGFGYDKTKDDAPLQWIKHYELRMCDLMDRYHPDVYYEDGGIPFHTYPAGLNLLAHLYNSSIANHQGKLEAVATIKLDWVPTVGVKDFERATPKDILELPWQSDKSVNKEWFWDRNQSSKTYTKAPPLIATLMDTVSRNGNLLLNVPLLEDGTLEKEVVQTLEEIGRCTSTIGEALYGTRPWVIYGEGPTRFNSGFPIATPKDIRFTRDKVNKTLYATFLAWPGNGATADITTLKAGAFDASSIASITMLGNSGELAYSQDQQGLKVTMPKSAPGADAYALKITFQTPSIPSFNQKMVAK